MYWLENNLSFQQKALNPPFPPDSPQTGMQRPFFKTVCFFHCCFIFSPSFLYGNLGFQERRKANEIHYYCCTMIFLFFFGTMIFNFYTVNAADHSTIVNVKLSSEVTEFSIRQHQTGGTTFLFKTGIHTFCYSNLN